MSGHSKWSTIKRKKGAQDARRGKIFTKLIREISTAARLGGADPDANPRLRLVVEKAKGANMPKDNIERAIQKGVGGGEGGGYQEVVYEGYGPAGVAVLVEGLTDNRNRTAGDLRHVFSKHGGNLGQAGCVAYLFEKRGVVEVDRSREGSTVDADAVLEAALEAGAEDAVEGAEAIEIVTAPADCDRVSRALRERGFPVASAEITMQPSTTVKLEGEDAATMLRLAEALEDLDDVQQVHANFDISDEEMARLA